VLGERPNIKGLCSVSNWAPQAGGSGFYWLRYSHLARPGSRELPDTRTIGWQVDSTAPRF
jgi:hypothetical protein